MSVTCAWLTVGAGTDLRRCQVALDLDQRVAEGDAAAPVGEGVVGEAVGDLAVGVMVAPPAPRDRRQTGPQAVS